MPRNWTNEQHEAIYAGGELLISAAAGAGKTAVLSERIAAIIAGGTPIDRLLVVTYTKAAAAEMKARIQARLYELAEEASGRGEGAASAALSAAASACERANISTLHSFCRSLLKRSYHEAGIDPETEIGDATVTAVLLDNAVDAVLERAYAESEAAPDWGFSALLAAVGGDDKLAELIKQLHAYAVAKPDPEGWLAKAASIYTDDFLASSELFTGVLISGAERELQALFDSAKELRSTLPESCFGARAAFDDDMSQLLSLMLLKDYDKLHDALGCVSYSRLSWPKDTDAGFKKPYQDHRDSMKAQIKKLQKLFGYTLEQEAAFTSRLAAPIARLCRLTCDLDAEYSRLKAEEGIMDYSDLEQLTLKVLKNPAIAEEYRRRFKHVFVDEYQDINPAQEAILAAVSDGNRFMVGDVKQSIYRFRQAEPNIFLEKYNTYTGEGGKRRIDLNRNFRSDPAILDTVNLLFSKLMRGEDAGQIDYSDNAALISGRDDLPPGEAELVLIESNASSGDEAPELADDASVEASYAANRILDMMARGSITENGAVRPCRWSDFTVLLRSAKTTARRWLSVLTDAGIPCVSQLGGGLTDAVEVRIFLDLLRVIDNRRQDIPLLAVMRSHIYSFTEEELIHVRTDYEGEDLLDRATAAAGDERQPEWSIKCKKLLSDLDRWNGLSRIMGVGELIGRLLDETGYEVCCAALYGGETRSENLNALWERACKLESGDIGGLSGFISYMDEASASSSVETPQAPFADAVRLMTIHRSKGLEFNIVFIGGITKQFNANYKSDVGIFDPDLGIGLCSVAGDREAKCLLQRAIAAREAVRLNAEEMRVLYVAQTRAKHKLIMLGAKKDARKYAAEQMTPLNYLRILNAKCFADWMLGAYFPTGSGEDASLPLPCGSALRFSVCDPQSAETAAGMDAEGFEQWRGGALLTDPAPIEKLFENNCISNPEADLPSKLSVTGLTLRAAQINELPRFMQGEERFSAADIGTLTHRLLQLISLRPHTVESVEAELAGLAARGYFTEREAAAVRRNAVLGFLDSALGQRLCASPLAEREKEFNLLIPASALLGAETDEPVMLQGVIDCCFIEDGEWVLIDHKTTRVEPNRTARTVAEQYRRQLELYAEALTRLTGKRVKQKYVYMLSVGEAVEL